MHALLALVRDLANGRDVTEIAAPPELVQLHNLGPLAARAGARAFRDDLVRATVAWARIARDLPPVVERLTDAGVRVAPIKGVAYATSIYAIPAERPMSDVDLLVEPRSDAAARRVLAELGFVRVTEAPALHHASTWIRGDLVVDLHWGIVGRGRSRIDFDAVWARTAPGWPAGASRLDPVDELVFHLVHMARDWLCGPLVQVIDATKLIARLPGADPEPAIDRARAWGLGAAAEVALRYVNAIVQGTTGRPGGWLLGPPADDVLAARQPGLVRRVVFNVVTAGSPAQLAAKVVASVASRLAR